MPKYFCDYCDTFLTHDSPSVRKTHCAGRKHKESVKFYYQKWMEEEAQKVIDATTAAFKARGRLGMGVSISPPNICVPFPPTTSMGVSIPPPTMGMGYNGTPYMMPPPPPRPEMASMHVDMRAMVPPSMGYVDMRTPMGYMGVGGMMFRPTA